MEYRRGIYWKRDILYKTNIRGGCVGGRRRGAIAPILKYKAGGFSASSSDMQTEKALILLRRAVS